MSNTEKELLQIKAIRRLRADSARRAQTAKAMAQRQAALRIDQTRDEFDDTQRRLIEMERDSLEKLTSGCFVKVEQLVGFTKQQQFGVKKIKDTRQNIETAQHKYEQAKVAYAESCTAVSAAEKRLLGIEEIIEQKLWT